MSSLKKFLLLTLITQSLWAKPLVIIAHFDPFGRSSTNNSTTVAHEISKILQNDSDVEVALCLLPTTFEKAFPKLEECIRSQSKTPSLVLGLGEAACDLKIETLTRNRDHSFSPDNAGTNRKNQKIIPTGEDYLGLSMTTEQMYCHLTNKEQKLVEISSDAGSFVCNNIIYQFSYTYPDDNFAFIHLPTSQCRGVESKNQKNIPVIIKMLKAGANAYSKEKIPTTQQRLILERNSRVNSCERNFYKGLKRNLGPLF